MHLQAVKLQPSDTDDMVMLGEDVINFRGQHGHLVRCDAANLPNKDGKVTVMVGGQLLYNYAAVWGLRVITIVDNRHA